MSRYNTEVPVCCRKELCLCQKSMRREQDPQCLINSMPIEHTLSPSSSQYETRSRHTRVKFKHPLLSLVGELSWRIWNDAVISKLKVSLLWAKSQAHVDIVKGMFNGWLKSLEKGDLPSSCKHTKEQRINRAELCVHIWKVPVLFPILWQTQRKWQKSSSYVKLNFPSFPTTNSYN